MAFPVYFFAKKWLAENVLAVLKSAPGCFRCNLSVRRITDADIEREDLQVFGRISDPKSKDAPYFLLEIDGASAELSDVPFIQGAAQGAMIAILTAKKSIETHPGLVALLESV